MFLHKLLVAVDDSEPSQNAIDVGLIIAQRDGCGIVFCVLLHPALAPQNYGFDSICEIAEAKANRILESAMQRANAAGVEASSKTMYHNACQGIIDLAHEVSAGLIVMGTHGRTGIARALQSSVAESVLRRTKTPLCVIRRPPVGIIHGRFLVPICADDLGKAATLYSIELARSFESKLLFCTVKKGTDAKSASDALDNAVRLARESGVDSDAVLLDGRDGIPDAILQQSGMQETDAIVMASHARDGITRFVQGSVTEAVIRSSLVPVVVIR